ncbi:hypothetical protein FVEG_13249 [Fusarium verticillioides 7600]|uniref:FAD-binding domain-containing protein n=1 Tax=Gibberella moniliformis (strain M3125 / FGSC 7600) TaxID=334819 RepID=W7MUL0_GIBM7|nr:hypothetical protein FVEG_13249 [Fusarium verticillioides 7600]EWG55213.1 hypothetical protein FVEG_13249 [Fusarium verticillioides 7600]
MAPLRVIIVGGGLSGACLANGLINKSDGQIDVTVFERDETGSERGGYQIRLGAHALIGFKACLTEEQYANLLPCFGKSGGVVSSAPCIFSPSDLKVLIDLSKAPVYEKSAPIARTRLRNFLQQPLQERDAIQFGKKYVRYEVLRGKEAGQSSIRVHFSDDTHHDCDVLISAEGSGSRINKQIGLNNIITEVTPGHGGYLGKCHLPWSVLQTLPRQLLEKGTIYTGNSKAMVFAAVYLPEALSSSKNEHTDILRLKDYDEDEASLFLGMAWTTGPEAAELPQVKDKKGLMKKKLTEASFHSDFHKLVDAVDDEAIMTTPWRYAKNNTPVDWRKQLLSKSENNSNPSIANPRVWLIGDSIHPMLPSRGMGANNAIHDTADALGPLLELAKLKNASGILTDEQVSEQLAVYEKAMMPRAFEWVKKSSNQQLPDLDSLTGRGIIIGLRVVLFVVSGFMNCLRMFGWEPKDDAPELH